MDAGDDCLPFFVSQLLQSGEEGEGSTAVQTRGGLLEQERERERVIPHMVQEKLERRQQTTLTICMLNFTLT